MAGRPSLAGLVPRFYNTLRQTETATPARIRTYQHGLLEKLVRHARAHVPFYRDTGRLEPLFRSDGRFDLAGWEDVPVLSRSEASDNAAALVATLVPPEMLPLYDDATSGSTGEPLAFKRSELAQVVSAALVARALAWHGATRPGAFAVLRPAGGGGSSSWAGTGAGGPLVIDTEGPVPEQLEALRRHTPVHVLGRSNVLDAIALAARATALRGVALVIQTGEALKPDTRVRIARGFGAPVVDLYSTSELGPIAVEGKDGRMRVCEENVFIDWAAEDSNGAPQPLVVTPFYAYGTPLIRYAPGDYVRFSSRTGRDTPALRQLAGVVGRERNMFRGLDGAVFSPELSGWHISKIAHIRRWRLTQTAHDAAMFEAVFDALPDDRQIEALTRLIGQAVPGMTVSVSPVQDLADERAAGKAFEAYRRLVPL